MGDLAGLADSIARYGLIQPIVIDERMQLVAGGRCLEACKRLGWDAIDVRLYGELSDRERAEIELEENTQREDLTPLELSQEHVRWAARVAPIISSAAEEKDPRGRKRQGAAPKEEVAKALGVGTLVRAEQHVQAAEAYPELAAADIPQRDALVMRKTLDDLPAAVRAEKLQALRERRPGILAELAGLPPLPDPRPPEQVVRARLDADPATHWQGHPGEHPPVAGADRERRRRGARRLLVRGGPPAGVPLLTPAEGVPGRRDPAAQDGDQRGRRAGCRGHDAGGS